MLTLLIVLGLILGYFLIGHIVWRIGLKIAFYEASDMVAMTHFFWWATFVIFIIEADFDTPRFFQRIIDKNDVDLQARLAQQKKHAADRRMIESQIKVTQSELDLSMEPSYPEIAEMLKFRSSDSILSDTYSYHRYL